MSDGRTVGTFLRDNNCTFQKLAYFLSGFTLLLPLRIGLNAASFCLKRFNLEEKLFSLYVSRVHNAMEMGCFCAVVLANIYVLVYGQNMELISIATNWLLFLVHILLFFVFVTGGRDGHLTLFYWSLVVSTFTYGLNQVCAFSLAGKNIVYFMAAMPISGIFTTVLQMIYLYFFGDRTMYETDYLLVTTQIALSILISLISASVWTVAHMARDHSIMLGTNGNEGNGQEEGGKKDVEGGKCSDEEKEEKEEKEESKKFTVNAISPMIMCIVGLGLVYAFYPGIAPGMLVRFKYVSRIDMVGLIVSAIPPIAVALISDLTKYGPNRPWKDNNYFWHYFLSFVIVEIACGILFLRALHYRDTIAAVAIMRNPILAGALTILFFVCHIVSISVGFAGVEPNSCSKIATANLFLSLLVMNVLELLGEGYVKEYKKYSKFHWPTRTMTSTEGFKFWIRNAAINAIESLKSTFSKDVRRDLLASMER